MKGQKVGVVFVTVTAKEKTNTKKSPNPKFLHELFRQKETYILLVLVVKLTQLNTGFDSSVSNSYPFE